MKDERLAELMEMQEEISLECNEQKIGETLRVVIDREEDDFYVGRTQFDSPDVDPEVLVHKSKCLSIGGFYDVMIKEAMPFELIGEVCNG